jgi:hypothetical protein
MGFGINLSAVDFDDLALGIEAAAYAGAGTPTVRCDVAAVNIDIAA